MFDFEKLTVYTKATEFVKMVRKLLTSLPQLDRSSRSQLNRAALSILLNIAEGSGRFTKPDKRNFFVIARGSVFECVALLKFLEAEGILTEQQILKLYNQAEELSKMLYAMIQILKK